VILPTNLPLGCYTEKIVKLSDFRPTRRNIRQFIAYFVGGTTYFWSGYLVFALCYSGFHWAWWPAKIAGDVVGWTLNYLVQRYWAFNSTSLKRHEGQTAEKYVLLTLFNFGLDYAIVGGLNAAGITPYIGFFISAGFFTVWNYFWYRFWVFFARTKSNQPKEESHG